MGQVIVQALGELQRLDANVHWFCPRTLVDDLAVYYDEDITDKHPKERDPTIRLQKIEEATKRRDAVLQGCKILAFDGSDAIQYRDWFLQSLEKQLARCDICIREYHRSRASLLQRLEAEFDHEDVQGFMEKFDDMNFERITRGLNSATNTLLDLPPQERHVVKLENDGTYALLESLHCLPFLQNEEALQQFFDRPFRLVQTNKKLKLLHYSPGSISFLFSHNQERSAWAFRNTGHIKRPLTGTEFDFSVKPFLEPALSRVNILTLDKQFLPVFWRATKLIITKLTKDPGKNKLRTLDSNIYADALEHFQIDDVHFSDLLSSYQSLLEISPRDFWVALGSVTAQAVAETIFRSPVLQRMLMTTDEKEPLKLEEKLEWPIVIVKSIAPANLVPPVRTILDQLLRQFQQDRYSRYARTVAWSKGLTCLLAGLEIMRDSAKSGPLVTNMIQVVAQDHIESIMLELTGIEKKNSELQIDETEQQSLDIVERTLSLDVAELTHDRSKVLNKATMDHELGVSGLNIWKMSMNRVQPGFPALATSILSGITGLLALENFTQKEIGGALKPAKGWNDALKRVFNYVCDQLLSHLDSFDPDNLDMLLQEPKAMNGIVSLLFNGETRVHQATLNVLKAVSAAEDRRGALMHIIRAYYRTTMPAINRALGVLCKSRSFAPCTIALKLCTDVFNCLCESHDGVLRSRDEARSDTGVLENYWTSTWQLLGMMFQETEPWSIRGHEKGVMQEFCRDAMAFAEYAFEQYPIISGSLQQARREDMSEIWKTLLEHPRQQFLHMARWLRLRDEYLISKAVSLTVKILGRLQEAGIEIHTEAAQFIEGVATTQVKTNLSGQQRAELRRALEQHLGRDLSGVAETDEVARPKKQTSLQDWASSGRSSGASTPVGGESRRSKSGTIDIEAWSANAKRRKALDAQQDSDMKELIGSSKGSESYRQQILQQRKKPGVVSANSKVVQKQQKDHSKDFLAKRQKEKDEFERNRKAALAKATGVSVGSGVAGLGDYGADHSLKDQSVMVNSDDESDVDEDDEDEFDSDLFGPTKKKIDRPNVDPNGAVGLRAEQKMGPTKIQRTSRSAKDMRARLAPDLTPLHRVILQWDFFHDGDYPPGANEYQFREVANSFNDPTTYQQTFQPLLTLEAWQGLAKAKEESASKPYEVKIQNRTNVDSFIELSSVISHVDNREIQLQESDIILLSKSKKPAEDATAPHCLARIYRIKRQKAGCEVLYQLWPSSSLAPSLAGGSVVWGLKVQSVTPLEREYGALQALQYYDLCNQIIRAKPSKKMHFSEKQIAAYQDVWNVNRAQSEAINAALENEGFSLIQGPPGSGKTKTIVAIVGGLLTHALGSSTSGTQISMPKSQGNQNTGGDAPPRKLLVCAPSNAAVDELVMRLKEGVLTKFGRHHKLNVVRIGRSDAINTQVLDVTMDELVARRLGSNENDKKLREKNAELFKEHEAVSTHLKQLYAKRDGGECKGQELTDLETEIVSVRKRKNELGIRIDNAKDAERNAGRQAELNRKKARQAILDEAHVICATLSGSGHDMFQSLNIEFETVIIDEAAQCVEMSSLIPLKYGCVKCVMVGDPKQLPPTVFSKEAAKFQYEQSLFVRMQNNFSNEVHLLDTQYRMHPDISIFPSQAFYDGLLKDGDAMAGLRERPWHASTLLGPYRFFDVAGQHQAAPKGHSLVNVAEVEVAIALYDRLTTDFPDYEYNGQIGVITPYKSQLRALKDRFASKFGKVIFDMVEFNTTDAFQGRESEIIIFSCVRASPAGGIGFLQDIRRMNVGLTRAKSSLWVLGNSESLSRGQYWKKLVENAQARDIYTTGNLRATLSKPSSAFPAEQSSTRAMLDIDSQVPQMNGATKDLAISANSTQVVSGTSTASTTNPDLQRREQLDTDRMEGIRYRFEDRATKKNNAAVSDATSDRSTPQPEASKISEAAEPQDIEMWDANDAGGRGGTPQSTVSRAETPLSGEEKSSSASSRAVKPRSGYVAPNVPPALKKRPAPSPFMPRKQQRSRQP